MFRLFVIYPIKNPNEAAEPAIDLPIVPTTPLFPGPTLLI